MSEKIDQFCESLRVKLTKMESSFEKMREGVHASLGEAEVEVRERRDAVAAEITAAQAEVADARNAAEKWVENAKTTSAETVASWKSNADAKHLALRADAAEAYASVTKKIANAALDEANLAALDAWLARHDADDATAKIDKA